jgi:Flp pilus assembly protein protease CpaA
VRLGTSVSIALIIFIVGVFANYWDWLGMGDVKLISALCLTLGFFSLFLALIAIGMSFVLAFLLVSIKLFRGKANFGQSIPLGPYLLISFIGSIAAQVWTNWA